MILLCDVFLIASILVSLKLAGIWGDVVESETQIFHAFTCEMGTHGRLFIDLNEPPSEDDKEVIASTPPQKLPNISDSSASSLFHQAPGSSWTPKNHGFSHSTQCSGFQPFFRFKEQLLSDSNLASVSSSSALQHCEDVKPLGRVAEREEGEWSDIEDGSDANHKKEEPKAEFTLMKNNTSVRGSDLHDDMKDVHSNVSSGAEGSASDCNSKGEGSGDGFDDSLINGRPKVVKGAEANQWLRIVNSVGKRPKIDEHKVAMLGKKRHRQTVFINIDEVKQAGTMKSTTPKRPPSFSSSLVTRAVKDSHRSSQLPSNKENRLTDSSNGDTSVTSVTNDFKVESNCDGTDTTARLKKAASANEVSVPKPALWKQHVESKQPRSSNQGQGAGDSKIVNKKNLPSKKPSANTSSFQDTSVERLLREVTNDKFWHHPGDISVHSNLANVYFLFLI